MPILPQPLILTESRVRSLATDWLGEIRQTTDNQSVWVREIGERLVAYLYGTEPLPPNTRDHDINVKGATIQVRCRRDHPDRGAPPKALKHLNGLRFDYLAIVKVDRDWLPKVVYIMDAATARKHQAPNGAIAITNHLVNDEESVKVIWGERGWVHGNYIRERAKRRRKVSSNTGL